MIYLTDKSRTLKKEDKEMIYLHFIYRVVLTIYGLNSSILSY